jgi:DNA-binding transcriptional LysR family regulator
MTSQQIAYFLALAKELHYWRTSYRMNITQSALSRQIQALESELKVELFKRSKRKVELTSAGKFLQEQWEPLLEQLNTTALYAQKIQQGEQGSIVINHPGSINYHLLPDLLARISVKYPAVKTELVQMKYVQEEEFLKSFRLDLSFSRYLHQSDFLESKLVEMESFAFAVPANHPIQSEADLTPGILAGQRFVLPTLEDGYSYTKLMNNIFSHYQIKPLVSYESDFGSTVLALVFKGLGISIIPYSFSQPAQTGIRFIKIPFELPLYLYWRKNEDNPLVRNILNLI